MAESQGAAGSSAPEVRGRLEEAARLLRGSDSVDLEVRSALVELLDELGRALELPDATPEEVGRLAEGVAHLGEALHRGHDHGVLAAARDHLTGLAFRAQTQAPAAVGLTRRVIDALANAGI